jgi:hypothetical protein
VEQIIGDCFECKVTTKQHNQEPVKPTVIPDKPWDVIAVDFGGPYPDGHYNLVAIYKRTRYLEVARTTSTSFHKTKEKLKTIFASHGIWRSTPHPATGVMPYEAMMNRPVQTKLAHRERNEQLRKPGNATVN